MVNTFRLRIINRFILLYDYERFQGENNATKEFTFEGSHIYINDKIKTIISFSNFGLITYYSLPLPMFKRANIGIDIRYLDAKINIEKINKDKAKEKKFSTFLPSIYANFEPLFKTGRIGIGPFIEASGIATPFGSALDSFIGLDFLYQKLLMGLSYKLGYKLQYIKGNPKGDSYLDIKSSGICMSLGIGF